MSLPLSEDMATEMDLPRPFHLIAEYFLKKILPLLVTNNAWSSWAGEMLVSCPSSISFQDNHLFPWHPSKGGSSILFMGSKILKHLIGFTLLLWLFYGCSFLCTACRTIVAYASTLIPLFLSPNSEIIPSLSGGLHSLEKKKTTTEI